MSDKKDEPKIYRVLCWGACIEGYPCGLEYQGMRYETGSLIALPPSIAKRHIEKGRLDLEKDKVRAHGGIPLEDATYVDVLVAGATLAGDSVIALGEEIYVAATAAENEAESIERLNTAIEDNIVVWDSSTGGSDALKDGG